MKVVILAGGLGTRLSEETGIRPKPMVEIGGKPILWHIMKIYSYYGFNEFIICLGYKGYMIKEYFANYFLHTSDVTIDIQNNSIETLNSTTEPWKVTLVDTGRETQTGGRVKRVQPYIGNNPFMLTYGDGVSDINIDDLLEFHHDHGKLVTVSAYHPKGKFGSLVMDGEEVKRFTEKPAADNTWVSMGFFVMQPEIFDYIEDDSTILEHYPLETVGSIGQMNAFKFDSFWKPMDTLRDKNELNALWNEGRPPWKIWKD